MTPRGRTIAVFGSSEPQPQDALYAEAREVGRLLAEAGWEVITGGYGGVMEAASRGAREGGGRAVGVTCRIFGDRPPNRFLDAVIPSRDLHDRTRLLIDGACGFVVLAGRAGTLAELAQLWALHRAGCLDQRRVVLLGTAWSRLLHALEEGPWLDPPQIRLHRIVTSAAEAVALFGVPDGGGKRGPAMESA